MKPRRRLTKSKNKPKPPIIITHDSSNALEVTLRQPATFDAIVTIHGRLKKRRWWTNTVKNDEHCEFVKIMFGRKRDGNPTHRLRILKATADEHRATKTTSIGQRPMMETIWMNTNDWWRELNLNLMTRWSSIEKENEWRVWEFGKHWSRQRV